LQEIRLDQFNTLLLKGNIGAGKNNFDDKKLPKILMQNCPERFADNSFCLNFIKIKIATLSFRNVFLADRYQQLSDDLAQFDLFKDFLVADYHILNLDFSKITLAEDSTVYRNLFDIIYKEMQKPDLYIYLYQNSERLLQNI
jgi:deoxyadenosine/deoxycytidine kinase